MRTVLVCFWQDQVGVVLRIKLESCLSIPPCSAVLYLLFYHECLWSLPRTLYAWLMLPKLHMVAIMMHDGWMSLREMSLSLIGVLRRALFDATRSTACRHGESYIDGYRRDGHYPTPMISRFSFRPFAWWPHWWRICWTHQVQQLRWALLWYSALSILSWVIDSLHLPVLIATDSTIVMTIGCVLIFPVSRTSAFFTFYRRRGNIGRHISNRLG